MRDVLLNALPRVNRTSLGGLDRIDGSHGGKLLNEAPLPYADARFAHEPADAALTPDQAFDRSWANGMIDGAIAALRAEYEKSGRGDLFDVLAPLVWGNASPASLVQHAARLGLKEDAFGVALHRFRRRVGERLRAAVAETVAEGADIDVELRHLIAAVGQR